MSERASSLRHSEVAGSAVGGLLAAVRRDHAACLAHRVTDTIKQLPKTSPDARRRRGGHGGIPPLDIGDDGGVTYRTRLSVSFKYEDEG